MTYKPNEKVQALLDAMRRMPQKPTWDSCDAAATLRVEQSQVAAYIKSAVDHGVLHKAVVNGRMLLSLQPFTADRLATAPSSAPPAFVPPRMGEARPVPPPPLGDPATKPRPPAEPPRPYAAIVTAPPRQQPLPPEPTPAPTKAPRANATGLGAWSKTPSVRELEASKRWVAATPAPAAAEVRPTTFSCLQEIVPGIAAAATPAIPKCGDCYSEECVEHGCATERRKRLDAPAPARFRGFLDTDGELVLHGADVRPDGTVRLTPAQWNLLRTRFAWSHA